MAKGDFLTGLLQGLYQGGVGNPEVQERRRQSALSEAFTKNQMDANAREQGLMPAPDDESSKVNGVFDFLRNTLFPGAGRTMNTTYVQDPNAQQTFLTPEGNVSSSPAAGAFKLTPKEAKSVAMMKAAKSEESPALRYQKDRDEAERARGKQLESARILTINEGQSVARMLPDVEKALTGNEAIFGPVEGRVRSANPYDLKGQSVDARMRTASQAFGRFMEGGVLRKEDEDKYRKMFPQLSDTPAVAKNKLSIVRRMLAEKYQSDKSALKGSGYDISGLGDLEIPPSIFEDAQSGSTPAMPKATMRWNPSTGKVEPY